MLQRVEAALDGLEIFGARGHGERVAYAQQLAREADRAGCEEVAMIARMVATGGKLDLETGVALARSSLEAIRAREEMTTDRS